MNEYPCHQSPIGSHQCVTTTVGPWTLTALMNKKSDNKNTTNADHSHRIVRILIRMHHISHHVIRKDKNYGKAQVGESKPQAFQTLRDCFMVIRT